MPRPIVNPGGNAAGGAHIGGGPPLIVTPGMSSLAQANFSTLAASSGIFTAPPSWLSIACATTGRTVQTSVSTVVSGIGANAWRARNAGSGQGLSVEASATNALWNSGTIGSWAINLGATKASAMGPDGVANSAIAETWPHTANATLINNGNHAANPALYQVWAIGVGGTTLMDATDFNLWDWHNTIGPTWALNSSIQSGSGTSIGFGNSGALIAAGSATWFGAQVVAGAKYPTSYIPTAGASVTRNPDVLSTTATIAPLGYLNATVTFAPNFANGEQANDSPLIWWSANNQICLQQSTNKIVVTVGGVAVLTSAALTWSREQGITVACHLAASGALTLTVSGATTGNGTTSATGVAAFGTVATTYLLGTSAGAQECADLRSIMFLVP